MKQLRRTNRKEKTFKTFKEKVISFVNRTYDELRAAFIALRERYKSGIVHFPEKMQMRYGLYSGEFLLQLPKQNKK